MTGRTDRRPDAAASPTPSLAQLTGQARDHVVDLSEFGPGVALHPELQAPLRALRQAAGEAGFDLKVASGFRDYARQLAIWNAKAGGARALFDRAERPVDAASLTPEQLLEALLHWSAVPGCSRHHWGTDLDVFDAAALRAGETLALTRAECEPGGPFCALHRWLDRRLADGAAFGFFRPYTGAGCAVAPEPWHLSWAPLAARCQASLSASRLLAAVLSGRPALAGLIEQRFTGIFQRYVQVEARCYPPPQRAILTPVG